MAGIAISAVAAASIDDTPPKLAVVLSIDQGRADYLERFRPWFGTGGFERLLSQGRVYEECRYRHAVTRTAPGHATMLSGVHADVHGIIGNDWMVSVEGAVGFEKINSVEDVDSPLVGLAAVQGVLPDSLVAVKSGRSPLNFLASTVGDQLKIRYGDRSKVVSIAGKDRSAILMGGHFSDGTYWRQWGRYVTSRFYTDQLPGWVESFNEAKSADHKFGRVWTRREPAALYNQVQGPDAAAGETEGTYGLAATFPKTIDGGGAELTKAFYDAFDISPFSITQLIDFALEAVKNEKLGQHEGPDLLCVGVSQTDRSGHLWGPDSHEMMDGILRLDAELARLLTGLDAAVGKENYVVVLTADHGVAPLPERVLALGGTVSAGRLDGQALEARVESALVKRFGVLAAGQDWFVRDGSSFRLLPAGMKGQDAAEVRLVVKNAVASAADIAGAWTREELLAAAPSGNDTLSLVRRSYHADRGSDVFYIHQAFVFEREAGTTHGDPHNYDRHVPLIWMGPGIEAGTVTESVAVEDLALTLSGLLGVEAPPRAEGRRLF